MVVNFKSIKVDNTLLIVPVNAACSSNLNPSLSHLEFVLIEIHTSAVGVMTSSGIKSPEYLISVAALSKGL